MIGVTGARGLVGQYVVRELLQHGYDVLAITRTPWEDCPCQQRSGVQLTDFSAFARALDGCEGLIHLANLPTPIGQDDTPEVFDNNLCADYHAMLLSGLMGFSKLVYASSTCALGFSFAHHRPEVLTLPIDENTPASPDNSYGLAKLLSERAAQGMVQRFPSLCIVGLRISYVAEPEAYAQRCSPDRLRSMANFDGNLASYVDARDCARAFRLALEAPLHGAELFYICNPDSMSLVPSPEAARRLFPAARFSQSLGRFQALESSRKARQLLGWVPEHSWREVLGVPSPEDLLHPDAP